jgi:hypothetical protein
MLKPYNALQNRAFISTKNPDIQYKKRSLNNAFLHSIKPLLADRENKVNIWRKFKAPLKWIRKKQIIR